MSAAPYGRADVGRTKRLYGSPWSEAYVRELLESGDYDRVVANGYEWTRDGHVQTPFALMILRRKK